MMSTNQQGNPIPTAAAQGYPVSAAQVGARVPETPLLSLSNTTSSPPLWAPNQPPLAPSQTPLALSASRKRRKGVYIISAILLAIVLIGGLGAYYVFSRSNAIPANAVVGQGFFVSSGQLNPGSAQGIADQFQIDLHNLADPLSGKSYYGWLLGDTHPAVEANPLQPPLQVSLPILLGKLPVNQGNIHFLYPGDSQHDNLFSVTSRFLITEEDTNVAPKSPSTDHSTWRYYAEIPQTPYGPNKLSALDHIRHLFYKETRVAVLGLPGGLDIWQLRDTEKLLEWSVSARDAWQAAPTDKSQFIRILDDIDGLPNVHVDLPSRTPVLADAFATKVGLLEVNPSSQGVDLLQNPPGYLTHVALHLNGVINAPDSTPQQRKLATQIIEGLTNATVWLKQVRMDAQQLAHMTNTQLRQPSTIALLDDLVTQATFAYIGRLDPTTNTVQPAILQVHYDIQQLAGFTITKNVPKSLLLPLQ